MSMPIALAAFNSSDRYRAAQLARRSAELVEPCIADAPDQIDLYMIAALDRRVLGEPEDAVRLYKAALEYDRRPEIYLQLGLTQLQLGRRQEARRALERAVLFDRATLDEIGDAELRESLSRLVSPAPPE